jgi:hypothetical protein
MKLKLASAFNDFGVAKSICENYLSHFEEPDFKASEIQSLIDSAYKKTANFGSRFFEDRPKLDLLKNMVLSGQERLGVEQLFMMISEMMPSPVKISFENKKNSGHYDMTPYKYQPSIGEKMIPRQTIDLGQGLLDTITWIYEEQEVIT